MIYLASKYSDRDALQRKTNFLLAQQTVASLIRTQHLPIFSPIVYCHEMAEQYGFPTDAGFWRSFNFAFLRKADALYQLVVPDWTSSIGCQMEHDLARQIGLPIRFVNSDGKVVSQYGETLETGTEK